MHNSDNTYTGGSAIIIMVSYIAGVCRYSPEPKVTDIRVSMAYYIALLPVQLGDCRTLWGKREKPVT